nr:hypothetical protein [Tanacetum cinerariifolium]
WFAREDVEKSENTATRISANSKNSTKEAFVGKNSPRNISELLDVAHGVTSVIVGTIITIHEEEGCWFLLQVRVQDETGTMSLTLWNNEITSLMGKKYAFKVSIDEYNVKKLLPVFTVLRLPDDPEILASIRLSVTPSKMDTEATYSALPNITPLLAMMKIWDGKMYVQNGYNAIKLFLFDATQPTVEEKFQDVKEYSGRLFARKDAEKSKNTATRISTNSKNSTKETFVGKNPPRNIVELLDVAQFWYLGRYFSYCGHNNYHSLGGRSCKKKVIREKEIIDLETDMPKKVRLYAFKVSIDEYNVKKLLPVFTMLRLSDDPEILASIRLSVTPSKMDSEATSSALPDITPLDCQTHIQPENRISSSVRFWLLVRFNYFRLCSVLVSGFFGFSAHQSLAWILG